MMAPFWLLLLLLADCLCAQGVRAQLQQDIVTVLGNEALSSRHLLARSEGNITLQGAKEALRNFGLDNSGTILYMSRSPVCPIEELQASARGQLFVFCETNDVKRKCQKSERMRRGIRPPLFRFTCLNHTCIETSSVEDTACLLNAMFDVPLANSANSSCEFDYPGVPTDNVSTPFTPEFLKTIGRSKSVFDCILGIPLGSRIQNVLTCKNGFFQAQTLLRLGGEPFLPEDVPFQCIWEGLCRDDQGCCAGDQLFEGTFICLTSEKIANLQLAPSASAASQQVHWVLLLVAFLLLGFAAA